MIISLLFAAMLGPPLPQEGPPSRIRNVILFGEEKCPEPQDPDEIVVCATSGESPYRIPKEFRDPPSEHPGAVSWSRKVEVVEQVNRADLPGGCSPVGTAAQTGCTRQMIQQWAQERLERRMKEQSVP